MSIEGKEKHDDQNKNNVEPKWDRLKKCMQTALKTVLPPKERMERKPWMTNEILKMMEERKKVKHRDPVQYKALNMHIHEACRTAKEEWFKDQCEESESSERQFRLREMHNKVSNLTGKNLKKNQVDVESIRMENYFLIKRK